MPRSHLLGLVGAFVGVLLACVSANAQQVTNGNIFEVLDATGNRIGSTVDYWGFTVNSAGDVTIDTLSWEADSEDRLDGDGDTAEAFDVNGDGEIAYIDPYIYLFRDDGSLDQGDLVSSNDDDFTNTYADGSLYGYDSYLGLALDPGDYVLAIGSFFLSTEEAVAGANDETSYPLSGNAFGASKNVPAGDYRITWTGDLTITSDPGTGVPEPSGLAALLLLLATTACGRRR